MEIQNEMMNKHWIMGFTSQSANVCLLTLISHQLTRGYGSTEDAYEREGVCGAFVLWEKNIPTSSSKSMLTVIP